MAHGDAKAPKPFSGQCTVNTVVVRYPHGEQAQADSEAALTYLALTQADIETESRDVTFTVLTRGDRRPDFQEGDTVTLTVQPKAAGTEVAPPPAKPDGILPARAQAGYGVAAVVLVPKDQETEQRAPAKSADSAKEPPKKSY